MESDLVCNFKKCRKNLGAFAWVTSCSHIFCDEDGSREFNKSYTCPACETRLSSKFDIVRIDLQPSDRYKSMVLAGQKPETIIEISSRAMDFWCYQAHQEKMYQQYQATKNKEKSSQMEQYYEQILGRIQAELNTLKSQLTARTKELTETKKKLSEASEKISERHRQYLKLQTMYDTLRRKCITPASFEGAGDGPSRATLGKNLETPIATGEDFLSAPNLSNNFNTIHSVITSNINSLAHSPAEREFALRPMGTPLPPNAPTTDDVPARMMFDLGLGVTTPSKMHGRKHRQERH